MTSCNDFEVAVEQRRRGALDAPAAAELAEHLSSCAGCRAFETRSTELEDTMRTHAARVSAEIDWNRLGRSLETWRRQLEAGTWKALAMVLLVVPVFWFAFGSAASALIGGLTVVIWGGLHARRAIGDAREAARAPDQLLVFLRGQLDRQIRIERQNTRVLPILALLPLLLLLDRGVSAASLLGTALLMALFAALALRARLRVLPRLRRERAELD
jgi:hypothetical protein